MDRKLFAYGVAALTAGASAQAANASIVVTPISPKLVPHDGFTDLFPDGGSTRSMSVAQNTDGVWLKNSVSGIQYASGSTTAGTIAPVVTGSVDSTLTYSPATGTVYLLGPKIDPATTAFPTDGSNQYVGFEVPASGGGFNYGYIELNTVPDPANAGDYITNVIQTAYDTTPNEAVPTSVPEPASLGVLALGSLAALRRRR